MRHLCSKEQKKNTYFGAYPMKPCVYPIYVIYAKNHNYATFDAGKQLHCKIFDKIVKFSLFHAQNKVKTCILELI